LELCNPLLICVDGIREHFTPAVVGHISGIIEWCFPSLKWGIVCRPRGQYNETLRNHSKR
jgi:hypothetical protein